MKGFKDFILLGNVAALAVAFVIGAAFGTLVQGFVKDFITPLMAIPG
ncbi:MAG: MscL family protein, partial [Actinomycetota bacterium]|nr:MscL family protein [Actinomycetota bacterium]